MIAIGYAGSFYERMLITCAVRTVLPSEFKDILTPTGTKKFTKRRWMGCTVVVSDNKEEIFFSTKINK